jgi:hypothetical protein
VVTKKKILAELDFLTNTISTQVRTTALGILALSWGLLIGESSTTTGLAAQLKWHFVGLGAAAVLVLFLDFLQYVVGYAGVFAIYKRMDDDKKTEGDYDVRKGFFRVRLIIFKLKIVALSLTVVWLLTVLGRSLVAFRGSRIYPIDFPRW